MEQGNKDRYFEKFINKNYDSDINPAFAGLEKTIIKDKLLNDRETRTYDPKIYTNKKVIVSNHILEVYDFEKPVRYGERAKKRPKHHIVHEVDYETGELTEHWEEYQDPKQVSDYDPLAARAANGRRAKNIFRRTVISNFDNGSKFFTLTFRDGSVNDVTDVAECNLAFRDFIKRMRRRFKDFKYCAVVEFQDSTEFRADGIARGAVHYHVVANVPFIAQAMLEMIWGNGFVDITGIEHVDNVGAYVSKYMAKNNDDPRLQGKKSYMTSHNIIRPIVIYSGEADEYAEKYADKNKKVFANSYIDGYREGNISYTEYNLNRDFKKDGD